MEKFIVVEIYERDVVGVAECGSVKEAVETANKLLKSHLEDLGRLSEFENGDGEFDEWSRATENNRNAWSNASVNWDAHIFDCSDRKVSDPQPKADEEYEIGGGGVDVWVKVEV